MYENYNEWAADLNNDGQVDIEDLRLLRDKVNNDRIYLYVNSPKETNLLKYYSFFSSQGDIYVDKELIPIPLNGTPTIPAGLHIISLPIPLTSGSVGNSGLFDGTLDTNIDYYIEWMVFPKTYSYTDPSYNIAYNCQYLKHVILPDNIRTLFGFDGCVSLEELIIPETVQVVRLFYQSVPNMNYSIRKVQFPKNYINITGIFTGHFPNLKDLDIYYSGISGNISGNMNLDNLKLHTNYLNLALPINLNNVTVKNLYSEGSSLVIAGNRVGTPTYDFYDNLETVTIGPTRLLGLFNFQSLTNLPKLKSIEILEGVEELYNCFNNIPINFIIKLPSSCKTILGGFTYVLGIEHPGNEQLYIYGISRNGQYLTDTVLKDSFKNVLEILTLTYSGDFDLSIDSHCINQYSYNISLANNSFNKRDVYINSNGDVYLSTSYNVSNLKVIAKILLCQWQTLNDCYAKMDELASSSYLPLGNNTYVECKKSKLFNLYAARLNIANNSLNSLYVKNLGSEYIKALIDLTSVESLSIQSLVIDDKSISIPTYSGASKRPLRIDKLEFVNTESIEGVKLTNIGQVIFPETLNLIEAYSGGNAPYPSFNGCTFNEKVILPDNLTIEDGSFTSARFNKGIQFGKNINLDLNYNFRNAYIVGDLDYNKFSQEPHFGNFISSTVTGKITVFKKEAVNTVFIPSLSYIVFPDIVKSILITGGGPPTASSPATGNLGISIYISKNCKYIAPGALSGSSSPRNVIYLGDGLEGWYANLSDSNVTMYVKDDLVNFFKSIPALSSKTIKPISEYTGPKFWK